MQGCFFQVCYSFFVQLISSCLVLNEIQISNFMIECSLSFFPIFSNIFDCSCRIHNLWKKVLVSETNCANVFYFFFDHVIHKTKNNNIVIWCICRLFMVLRRFPIESKGRQKKLKEVMCPIFPNIDVPIYTRKDNKMQQLMKH